MSKHCAVLQNKCLRNQLIKALSVMERKTIKGLKIVLVCKKRYNCKTCYFIIAKLTIFHASLTQKGERIFFLFKKFLKLKTDNIFHISVDSKTPPPPPHHHHHHHHHNLF